MSFLKSPRNLTIIALISILSACGGGGSDPTEASASDIAVGTSLSGPTPFISFLPINGSSIKKIIRYDYTIEPLPGSVSKPVHVSYSPDALIQKKYLTGGADTMTMPIFGLYAGNSNRIKILLRFSDNSVQEIDTAISTPVYVDPSGVYDHVNILKKRTENDKIDFDYFLMKSSTNGPMVVDTDGQIRWVSPLAINAYSSIFSENKFIVGDADSTDIHIIELDGKIANTVLNTTNYQKFHHNIDSGKNALLGEFNTLVGGEDNLESTLAEFTPSGEILNQWDFAAILGNYMSSNGDDPSTFIRPGVDWFHMNASTYDASDDSIIASSRENFVIKIDYHTGNIKWILGDPTKYWYTFPSLRAKALNLNADGLYPIGQHAISMTSDGFMMLFNNGAPSYNQPSDKPTGASRSYSAVSVYSIDTTYMSANNIWNFDYDKSISSRICSSAYQTANRSTIISYATANDGSNARLVGLDPAGNVVFDFEYTNKSTCSSSWNANVIRFEDLKIM
ncbi:MAG: aryl-sulfate sulfotransferase [Comamonadaceae bacterium]|nr:aryl-sulfate sulfotransferase [Comamonadaceae bacterium]